MITGALSICGGLTFLKYSIVLIPTIDVGLNVFSGPSLSRTLWSMVLTLLPFVVAGYVLHRKREYVFIKIMVYLFIAAWLLGFIRLINP
ncbi:putative membrane protein YfhO [Paenibacillus sp. JGP012]|nr:putative membrane protein YfhO [Paenibacillus sp. JGP012]